MKEDGITAAPTEQGCVCVCVLMSCMAVSCSPNASIVLTYYLQGAMLGRRLPPPATPAHREEE